MVFAFASCSIRAKRLGRSTRRLGAGTPRGSWRGKREDIDNDGPWGCSKLLGSLVDLVGIEPTTSSMPWKRAPSCATGPLGAEGNCYLSILA